MSTSVFDLKECEICGNQSLRTCSVCGIETCVNHSIPFVDPQTEEASFRCPEHAKGG